MIGQFVAAFIGTVAFGYLFGIPATYYGYCGLCGSIAWGVYTFPFWNSDVVASFFATLVAAFLARLFAVWKRCPVTIFLISGLIPLVPGVGLYWTFYYLVTNQLEQMSSTGLVAVKSACTIVVGIVFVFEIPQKFFRFLAAGFHKGETCKKEKDNSGKGKNQ